MHRWMTNVCKRYADRTLIRPSYQYKDVLKMSKEKQDAYRRQGIRPGSRVTLCEHNSISLLSKLHALWELAAVPCLVPPRIPQDKRQQCEQLARKSFFDDDRMGSVDALIMFTSGTSATIPKGVRLSHTNLCMHIDMIEEHVPTDMLTHDDCTFSFLPWTHCYGLMGECFTVMNRGASMNVLSPECQTAFSFPRFYRDLQWTQPSVLFVVPHLLEVIIERDRAIRKYIPSKRLRRSLWFGKNLRFIVSGGAVLRPHVRRQYWEELEIPIYQGYGCTEMSPMIALQTTFDVDDMSVGKLLPHIQLRLEDNEVWVNGPNRFRGYAMEPSLSYDAFHNTRDRGYLDSRGQLVLTGRTSDVVKLKNGRFMNIQDLESTLKDMVPYAVDVCLWQQESTGDFVGVVHIDHPRFSMDIPDHKFGKVRIFSEDVTVLCLKESFKKVGDGTMTIKGEKCRPFIQSMYDAHFLDVSLRRK